jgi:NAD(P)-dependent dehydrogenase (short-subunit alcohol dehydrogenase family)
VSRLAGHVAIVTGGNRGIGLGVAEGLVRAAPRWRCGPGTPGATPRRVPTSTGWAMRPVAAAERWRSPATSATNDNERWVDATLRHTPVRRWGVPGDFGELAAYLAHPALVFHTGDSIVVDGGYSIFRPPAALSAG